MADKIILRPEPYDPDAVDADGDGIVQERTPWERPAGTRLLDKFGNAVEQGRSLTERPEGLQIVDRDGKKVPYTPSYGSGEAAPKTGKGTPLGDHGARSLKEMGLQNVQEMTAPPPPQAAPDTIPKPVSRTAVPEKLPEPPKKPYDPVPPPLSGDAQKLADEAGGDWRKFADLLNKQGFVVFDYETTGFDNGNVPVQIGAVKVQNGKVVARMNIYVNPERGLSEWSQKNLKDEFGNPLTDEYLAKQPSLREAHQQLAEFMSGSIIAAHNLPFDQEVLDRTLREQGIAPTHTGGIDTLELARQIMPKGEGGPQSHALGPLADHLGIPLTGWHTADADSETAARILGASLRIAVDRNPKGQILNSKFQEERFASAKERHAKELAAYQKARDEYNRLAAAGEDVPPLPADESPVETQVSGEKFPIGLFVDANREQPWNKGSSNWDSVNYRKAVDEALATEKGLSNEQKDIITSIAMNSAYWLSQLDASGSLSTLVGTILGGALDADGGHYEFFEGLWMWGGKAAVAVPLAGLATRLELTKYQIAALTDKMKKHFDEKKIKAGELTAAFKARLASAMERIRSTFEAKRNGRLPGNIDIDPNVPLNIRDIDDSTPEGILKKNKAIAAKIAKGGSKFGALSEESIDRLGDRLKRFSTVFTPMTTKGYSRRRVEAQKFAISKLKQALGVPVGEGEIAQSEQNLEWTRLATDRLHPEVAEFLRTASPEEIIARVQAAAIRLHEEMRDSPVMVSMPPTGRLDAFLTNGHYLTAHEVKTDHGAPDIRRAYEATLGIDLDADPDVRPASGWMGHPDWVDSDDPLNLKGAGSPDLYGAVQVRLKPETKGRAQYTRGDSLNSGGQVVSFDETDPDVIANALLDGQFLDNGIAITQILRFLEADRTGSFARVNKNDGHIPDATDPQGDYYEALIPGGFSVQEVEEITMSYSDLAKFGLRDRGKGSDVEDLKTLLPTEKLRELGFTEEEIDFFFGQLEEGETFMSLGIRQLASFKAALREKERIEALGPKLTIIGKSNGSRVDPFDPVSHGGAAGDDIEQILTARITSGIRAAVQRKMNAPKPVPPTGDAVL